MSTTSKTPSYPTSDYTDTGTAAAAGSQTLDRAKQSAQEAAERLSEKAHAAAGQMKEGIGEAREALGAGLEDLNALQEEWLASARGYVQEHPLVSVAVALAAGMLLARLLVTPSQQSSRYH